MKRLLGGALVALACIVPANPSGAQGDGNLPLDLLQRAAATWSAKPTPRYIAYDVNFRGTRKGASFARTMHVAYEAATRRYSAQVIAASGKQPPGVDAVRQQLFPDETFGLVPRERTPANETASSERLPVIGGARAVTRYPYDVALTGTEEVQGRPAHHLRLTPRGDSERYALRDVWVDVESLDVRKIVAYKVEHKGPVSVPFLLTVEYAAFGPYWLVERGAAGATAHLLFFTISAQGVATYTNYAFPEGLPGG